MCGMKPAEGVHVKLWDEDSGTYLVLHRLSTVNR